MRIAYPSPPTNPPENGKNPPRMGLHGLEAKGEKFPGEGGRVSPLPPLGSLRPSSASGQPPATRTPKPSPSRPEIAHEKIRFFAGCPRSPGVPPQLPARSSLTRTHPQAFAVSKNSPAASPQSPASPRLPRPLPAPVVFAFSPRHFAAFSPVLAPSGACQSPFPSPPCSAPSVRAGTHACKLSGFPPAPSYPGFPPPRKREASFSPCVF